MIQGSYQWLGLLQVDLVLCHPHNNLCQILCPLCLTEWYRSILQWPPKPYIRKCWSKRTMLILCPWPAKVLCDRPDESFVIFECWSKLLRRRIDHVVPKPRICACLQRESPVMTTKYALLSPVPPSERLQKCDTFDRITKGWWNHGTFWPWCHMSSPNGKFNSAHWCAWHDCEFQVLNECMNWINLPGSPIQG